MTKFKAAFTILSALLFLLMAPALPAGAQEPPVEPAPVLLPEQEVDKPLLDENGRPVCSTGTTDIQHDDPDNPGTLITTSFNRSTVCAATALVREIMPPVINGPYVESVPMVSRTVVKTVLTTVTTIDNTDPDNPETLTDYVESFELVTKSVPNYFAIQKAWEAYDSQTDSLDSIHAAWWEWTSTPPTEREGDPPPRPEPYQVCRGDYRTTDANGNIVVEADGAEGDYDADLALTGCTKHNYIAVPQHYNLPQGTTAPTHDAYTATKSVQTVDGAVITTTTATAPTTVMITRATDPATEIAACVSENAHLEAGKCASFFATQGQTLPAVFEPYTPVLYDTTDDAESAEETAYEEEVDAKWDAYFDAKDELAAKGDYLKCYYPFPDSQPDFYDCTVYQGTGSTP